MKYRGWIAFSGMIWFAIGAMLLFKGVKFIHLGTIQTNSLCHSYGPMFGSNERAATVLIAIGLFVGFLKGRFVLVKTVRRVVLRIVSLPLPIRFKDVYTSSYYLLIAGMMGLGMLFRFMPISVDFRGVIDVAIGSALINGAMLYFRAARSYDKGSRVQSP